MCSIRATRRSLTGLTQRSHNWPCHLEISAIYIFLLFQLYAEDKLGARSHWPFFTIRVRTPSRVAHRSKQKLDNTRFPDEINDAEWAYGAPLVCADIRAAN